MDEARQDLPCVDDPSTSTSKSSDGNDKDASHTVSILLKGMELQPDHVELCRVSIKMMSEEVTFIKRAIETAKGFILNSIQTIVYGNCKNSIHKNAVWIQLIIRTIDVWGCENSTCKRKYALANEALIKKMRMLEKGVTEVFKVYLKRQKDLKILDQAIKLHPEIVKFRNIISPFKVVQVMENEDVVLAEPGQHGIDEELIIQFEDSDMKITLIFKDETGAITSSKTFFLRELDHASQGDVVCIPIYQQIRTINIAIYNVQAAKRMLDSIRICELWEIIVPPKIIGPTFKTLENLVMAVLVNTASGSVHSLSPILVSLNDNLRHFSFMIQILRLHAVDKQLVDKGSNNDLSRQEKHELKQLHFYMDQIPDVFDIWDRSLAREYTKAIEVSIRIPDSHSTLNKFMNRPTNSSSESESMKT